MSGKLQHGHEGDPDRRTDQQPARVCDGRILRHRKHSGAQRGDDGTGRQQAPGPETIGQDTGGNLHCHIAVVIERRQIAEARRRQRKGVSQFGGDHRGRNALIKTNEVECGAQPPHCPGQ